MKKIIKKTKEDLTKEIVRLKRIVKTLIGFVITIVILIPWSAIFLGAKVGAELGMLSLLISLYVVKILKDRKIL